jgi:hydrogenase maturation protease
VNGDGRTEDVAIVGIGDERKRDDAIGLIIARELMERALPNGVRVEVAGEEGVDLVAAIDGAQRAIILAAIALGDEPGTIHALSPGDAEAQADYISAPGEVALIDALELSAMRGGPDVLIVGIEPAEIVPGQTLHPEVQASVGEAAEIARDLATGNREWRFFARGDFE